MRIDLLEEWRYALSRAKAKFKSPRPHSRALGGWALFGVAVALGTGTAFPLPAAAEAPPSRLAFADVDPGPPPKREDYKTDADYWLAYLRWLYAVNGGDPSTLRNAGMAETATEVAAFYAEVGWRVDESRYSRGEIIAATNEMLAFAKFDQLGVSSFERMLMKGAALAVQATVPSTP